MDIKKEPWKIQRFVLSLLCDSDWSPKCERTRCVQVYPEKIGILPKGKIFSVFNSRHSTEAANVYNFLIARSDAEFTEAVDRLRGILNEGLFLYALSVALLHRKKGTLLPPIWQICPSQFFSSAQIRDAWHCAELKDAVTSAEGAAPEGIVPWNDIPSFTTGNLRDPEFKLAWWREDIGLNDHHWQWHKVYPYAGINNATKDREGEIFYYMHHQMIARYDAERLAVGFMRVLPFDDWTVPIQEGYNAHLSDYYGTSQYAPRPAGMTLADKYIDPAHPVTIRQQNYNVGRLIEAIGTGSFLKEDGSTTPVDIVSLGAAVEASISSPNPRLYGSVHNLGHDLLSVIADPDGGHNQQVGVMADNSVSARDPIFYRWHKFLDGLFQQYKTGLTPYTESDLDLKNVTVDDISVKISLVKPECPRSESPRSPLAKEPAFSLMATFARLLNQGVSMANPLICLRAGRAPANVLRTFMEDKFVNIKYDIFHDLGQKLKDPHSDVWVKVTVANHDDFEYDIRVTNSSTASLKVAFRIFLAPRFDEQSRRYGLNDQRILFIELDKFIKELKPGETRIKRSSKDSSVVRPPPKTFEELLEMVKKDKPCTGCGDERYCKCGWPSNLLIPRGTAQGMTFDLFVMVTDWSKDKVAGGTDDLDSGTSYCGTKSKKYPDRRALGFPFDRLIDEKFLSTLDPSIDSFTSYFNNMKTTPMKIVFDDAKQEAKIPEENVLKY